MTVTMLWKSLVVYFVSVLPFAECKGAIVLARVLQVPHLLAGVVSLIGSYTPVPFLLYTKRGKQMGLEQKKKGIPEKFRTYIQRYGCLALLVMIAIPFTGMGCWIGAMLARIMRLNKLKAAVCIFIGNAIAVLVMSGAVHGIVTGLKLLF